VKVHWLDFAVGAAIAAAGCALIYVAAVRALRRAIAERQQATDRQLRALAMTVRALQARVVELGGAEGAGTEAGSAEGAAGTPENMAGEQGEQLKPETLAAITAAATAFLGKRARIRSARALPAAQDPVGAWAQQGRVFVQTSHNLRPRG